jgi:hypothetical protein
MFTFDLKNLDNLNPATRFYIPGTENSQWVDLRVPAEDDFRAFRKVCSKKVIHEVINKETRRVEIVTSEDVDDEKLNELLNDFYIPDWCILDADGNKIPCTKEMKITILGKHRKFSDWISEKLTLLRSANENDKELERKN